MIKEDTAENNGPEMNMGLLGDYLKEKRLEKNYTLEKLSQKTKISVNILKSLEANDYDHLPSAAYIKGFVTNYVKVLGLPQDEAINKMEYTYLNILGKPFPALNHTKAMSAPTDKIGREGEPSPHEVIENSDTILESTKSMLPIIIFGVVILLFVGGYKLVSTIVEDEVGNKKSKDLGPKIESSSALINNHAKKVEPAATPAASSSESKEATPTTSAAPEEKKEDVKPQFQRNFPTVEFKKVRGKLFSVKTDAPENDDTNLLPARIKSSMNPELQNIYIKAVEGNTWVSYKIDDKPIESAIISKDNDLLLQGSEIRIFLGNVNVTKIFYNNYLIDAPTKTGLKSLIFPEESNAKYQLPLFPKAKDDILYTAEEYIKRMTLEEDELEKKKED